ncbi:MAG: acyl carrier protein [Nostoc sp.]|uniref:acyl carrier protein n=1 Tax=Nostoc sp. TaxID=1180 RepID=UPI002FF8F7AB
MENVSFEVNQISTNSVTYDEIGKKNVKNQVRKVGEIEAWIVSYLADMLNINPDKIDTSIPFDRYGLDSAGAVGMSGDLEGWLGSEFEPTLLYDYPTVDTLAKYLAAEAQVE